MIKKVTLLFNTVKHLKPIQVFYQLKYRLIKAGTLNNYNKDYSAEKVRSLSFAQQPPVYKSYFGQNLFVFLNQKVQFDAEIDWNYQENGKLWNYNLQYANWLLQDDVGYGEKIRLLTSLYERLNKGQLAVEPYPVSLRAINVMRLFSYENKVDDAILANTHAELDFLSKRPEYHLLGNHLLENAFALMMGGAFFSNKKWTEQGQLILEKELEEQILSDGAHFELSPMYHQIIFFRLLELIDWYSRWSLKEASFELYLKQKATLMLSWLKNVSFENGDIPHFNDSAEGIAYSSNWLYDYADKIGISSIDVSLNRSGYRSVMKPFYECKIDCAQLGPSYQPGHAHADTLSFELHLKGKPFIVDSGTSTYEINDTRFHERSTKAHNTVTINDKNSSEVWSGHRVARRATVKIHKDELDRVVASHDGYIKRIGVKHTRDISLSENGVVIVDDIQNEEGVANFHFAPDIKLNISGNQLEGDGFNIVFQNNGSLELKPSYYSPEFNKRIENTKLEVSFHGKLTTHIFVK